VPATYDALKEAVEDSLGLYVTNMAELRDIRGAGRLSTGICAAISDDLAAHGLGHLPPVLPTSQWGEARIYRLGSPIAAVANAVLHPSEAGDRTLRGLATDDARDILRRVRELVAES
jgi:hypothetical protein